MTDTETGAVREYRIALALIWVMTMVAMLAMGYVGVMWISVVAMVLGTVVVGWYWE